MKTRIIIVIIMLAVAANADCRASIFDSARPDISATMNGRVWFVRAGGAGARERGPEVRVRRIEFVSTAADSAEGLRVEAVSEIDKRKLLLVPGFGRMWVVGESFTGYISDGNVNEIRTVHKLLNIVSVFQHKGAPAVITSVRNTYAIHELHGDDWKEMARFSLPKGFFLNNETGARGSDGPRAVDVDGEIHLFIRLNDAIMHHVGVGPETADRKLWRAALRNVERSWRVVVIGHEPAVFYYHEEGVFGRVTGYRRNGSDWDVIYTGARKFLNSEFGVNSMGGDNSSYAVLSGTITGRLRCEIFSGGVRTVKDVGQVNFKSMMMPCIMLMYLYMAVLVSVLILKPLWFMRSGLIMYKDEKEYPLDKMSSDAVMAHDFSGAKNSVVRKYPKRKVIVVFTRRMAALRATNQRPNTGNGVMFVEDATRTVKFRFESRSYVIYVFAPFMLMILIMLMPLLYISSAPYQLRVLLFVMVIMVFAVSMIAMKSEKKAASEQGELTFKLLLAHLGLEEPPVVKERGVVI